MLNQNIKNTNFAVKKHKHVRQGLHSDCLMAFGVLFCFFNDMETQKPFMVLL